MIVSPTASIVPFPDPNANVILVEFMPEATDEARSEALAGAGKSTRRPKLVNVTAGTLETKLIYFFQ